MFFRSSNNPYILTKWSGNGDLGMGSALLAVVVAVPLTVQLYSLHPKTDNMG